MANFENFRRLMTRTDVAEMPVSYKTES